MKNDRQTYKDQYSPSGGIARCISICFLVEIVGRLPLARGDTDSETITQTICHCVRWCCLLADRHGLPTRSRSHPERSEGSATVNQILRPEKTGLRMTESLYGNLPLAKPPTGFWESDVGESPGGECDIGPTLDELVSSELEPTQLETTKLTEDIVREGCCLTMDSRKFRLCQN